MAPEILKLQPDEVPASLDRSSARVPGLSSVAASRISTTSNPAAYSTRSQCAAPRSRARGSGSASTWPTGSLASACSSQRWQMNDRISRLVPEGGVHGARGHACLAGDGLHAGRAVAAV